jgi:hypothetical protein
MNGEVKTEVVHAYVCVCVCVCVGVGGCMCVAKRALTNLVSCGNLCNMCKLCE